MGQPREINWKVPHRIEGEGVWVEQKQIFRGTFAETLELWDFPFDVQVGDETGPGAMLVMLHLKLIRVASGIAGELKDNGECSVVKFL